MIFKANDLKKINYLILNKIHQNDFCEVEIQFDDIVFVDSICFLNSEKVKLQIYVENNYIYIENTDIYFEENQIYLNSVKTHRIKVYCLEMNIDNLIFYTRIYNRLYLATRSDGVGCRFQAMLNANYLAKINHGKFGFIWNTRNKVFNEDIYVAQEIDIFEKQYIDEYSYSSNINRKNLLKGEKKIIYCSGIDYNRPLWQMNLIKNLDIEDYKIECRRMWKSIQFSQKYKDVMLLSKKCAEYISGGFVAVHIRNGDNIYSDKYRFAIDCGAHISRYMPIEIAYELIVSLLKNKQNVVIFSPYYKIEVLDSALNNFILDHHKDDLGMFYWSSDLLKDHLDEMSMTFYDLTLMSYAKKFYGTPLSRFGLFSTLIGGGEFIDYTVLFDKSEQYVIIQKNKHLFVDIHNYEKSVMCYYLYLLSEELNMDYDVSEKHLLDANKFNQDNMVWQNTLLGLMLKHKKYKEADELAKKLISNPNYIKQCFTVFRGKFVNKPVWDYCLKIANSKYPYIALISYYISIIRNDLEHAIRFLSFYLENNEKKDIFPIKLFQKFLKEICNYYIVTNRKQAKTYKNSIARVRKHLAYRLGLVFEQNSKNIFGLPFILSYEYKKFKLDKEKYNIKVSKNKECLLPPLKMYEDYEKALKEKKSQRYKIGEALIKAHKNWYKGGYIKFLLDVYKLRKEYKDKKR